MATTDLRTFLEELVLRYDPTASLEDGARARTELIDPIIQRVGLDPIDTDVHTFIRESIRQRFPELDITEVDALTDTLVDPMRVLLEPIIREIKLVRLRSDLRNAEALGDAEVDSLLGNFFEERVRGALSRGVVRLYYSVPQTATVNATNYAIGPGGLRFFPTRPQQILMDAMIGNVEGSEYYFDVFYEAEKPGSEYDIDPLSIRSVANMPAVVRVRNPRRFSMGAPRESNSEFMARAGAGMSDKTLVSSPGIQRVLREAFPSIRQLFSVGFRDPEMQRDIVQGGGLGPIPPDSLSGPYYGTGHMQKATGGGFLSRVLKAVSGGNYTAHIGAPGTQPEDWWVTLAFDDGGGSQVVDAKIVQVIDTDTLLLDRDFAWVPGNSSHPELSAYSMMWALRRRELTVSGIPGGITFPLAADGTTTVTGAGVHIGGKADVYIAGGTEAETATIGRLTDAQPFMAGRANTGGSRLVGISPFLSFSDWDQLIGMALVLEEGVDTGVHPIIGVQVTGPAALPPGTPPCDLILPYALSGAQSNLRFKIVDQIDVELTDPKHVKITGDSLLSSAGGSTVTTSSADNFVDVEVRQNDTLEILNAGIATGEYLIAEVSSTQLVLDRPVPRTLTGAAYRVFQRFDAVLTPIVKIDGVELVDGTGAPVGIRIPPRDPVAVLSKDFGNEGQDLVYEGPASMGLLLSTDWASLSGSLRVRVWRGGDVAKVPDASGTLTFGPVATSQDARDAFDSFFISKGLGQEVEVAVVTRGIQDYVTISADLVIMLDRGTGTAENMIGGPGGIYGNSMIFVPSRNMREGDVIEIREGGNRGLLTRVMGSAGSSLTGWAGLGARRLATLLTTITIPLYRHTPLYPSFDVAVRVGRPTIGSARAFFTEPTSIELGAEALLVAGEELLYRPDPDNYRMILPAPPNSELPAGGTIDANDVGGEVVTTLEDPSKDFLALGVRPGDVLDILYVPIIGSTPLPNPGDVIVGGTAFYLTLGSGAPITIKFPYDMPRQDVVDFINQQAGIQLASILSTGEIRLGASVAFSISGPTVGDALAVLDLTPGSNAHPYAGSMAISEVQSYNTLLISEFTGLGSALSPAVSDTYYRIRRFTQRVSSTEMEGNLDPSGLYYADFELLALVPGDHTILEAGTRLELTGHRSDGYRLRPGNEVLTYSRAEELFAEFSRTILIPGSTDAPEEYVQLSRQAISVTYSRSQLVDDVQNFTDSELRRIVTSEYLVRHLLPQIVMLNWTYVGGPPETEVRRALERELDLLEPDQGLEVTRLLRVLTARGATSIFTPNQRSGRQEPLVVILNHTSDRRVEGHIVRDLSNTSRMQRFISGGLNLRRLTSGS